jgi:hypothetical protein
MKKALVLFLALILISGCGFKSKKEAPYLIKINNYTITFQEFEEQFKESTYAKNDTPESRKEFLNILVRKVLILQDAQKRNLDKDKEFLKMIERFWEQALLKRVIEKKTQEISGSFFVSDKEIQEAYNKLKEEGKAEQSYEKMYGQLKWKLTQLKESQAMDKWIAQLYKNATIKINSAYIKKEALPKY